jgi:6-phosphogluconate dehydrogenase
MPHRTSEGKAQFGVIGLAVMGSNLAKNVADHGFRIAVWNRHGEAVDRFMADFGTAHGSIGAKSIQELVSSLERPRRIMLMIAAGKPVDLLIGQLAPLLDPGDIIIDGGNSWFLDTRRRESELAAAGISFFGSGVSGGEEGARHGPSLMPGGSREAYEHVRPVFEAIAATTASGPCVTYCGPDGAGHFVKMVHNGIEYGDMQLIAEAYDLLRRGLGLHPAAIADVFGEWNQGDLESFLIEITATILRVTDPKTGAPLVDMILDKAGQKGTGKWTNQVALDLGIPVPTFAAAIDARVLSSMKSERAIASRAISGPEAGRWGMGQTEAIQSVHDALLASKICSYTQGMNLIRTASEEYQWDVSLAELARIWKGGCIIRAQFLDSIRQAYERKPDLPSLLLDQDFRGWMQAAQPAWRNAVMAGHQLGIPLLAMGASLSYFDSYRTEVLPQSLTQAQRDFFGAHTYIRVDDPDGSPVHTDWQGIEGTE